MFNILLIRKSCSQISLNFEKLDSRTMPYYDYICKNCKRSSKLFFSYAEYGTATAVCAHCQSEQMTRRIGRVAVAKSEEARTEQLMGGGFDFDENDPKSMGQFMRKMQNEMGEGEALGAEFDEVVDRLEKGQTPEQIEKAMPDLADSAGADV